MASQPRTVKSAGRPASGSSLKCVWDRGRLASSRQEGNTDRNATRAVLIEPVTFFAVVIRFNSFDNYAPLWCFIATARRSGGNAMDMLFGTISAPTFWKILLFVHFALAVAL